MSRRSLILISDSEARARARAREKRNEGDRGEEVSRSDEKKAKESKDKKRFSSLLCMA